MPRYLPTDLTGYDRDDPRWPLIAGTGPDTTIMRLTMNGPINPSPDKWNNSRVGDIALTSSGWERGRAMTTAMSRTVDIGCDPGWV